MTDYTDFVGLETFAVAADVTHFEAEVGLSGRGHGGVPAQLWLPPGHDWPGPIGDREAKAYGKHDVST